MKTQAVALIERLPQDKLHTAVDFLTYLEDREAWEATWELTRDSEVTASLRRCDKDVQGGKVKCWKDVRQDV